MPGNTYEGDHVRIAFDALTKDVKVADQQTVQPLGQPRAVNDAATGLTTARAAWLADKQNAHRATAA